jgi:DNA-binding CsgD family transcriptional regulator
MSSHRSIKASARGRGNARRGRPPALSDVAIADILVWAATHRSLREVARQHRVTVNTVRAVLARRGAYARGDQTSE